MRKQFVEACAASGRPPLVTAMALALARDDDGLYERVACLLIACKFEEVYHPDSCALARALSGVHRAPPRSVLVDAERDVLARCQWDLPYRTHTRRLLHLLEDSDPFYDEAAHVLLWGRLGTLLSLGEWAQALRDARDGRCVAPALQLAAARLRGRAKRVFSRFRARVLPPRIRHHH